MAEVKIRKKDIQEARQPDAVLVGATSAFDWIVERQKAVVGALAVILLAVGVYSVMTSQADSARRETGAKLAAAAANLTKPVIEKSTDEKSFPSKDAKQKAIEESLGAVAKDRPGSNAAEVASMALARTAIDAGKFDDAISAYETYLKSHPDGAMALFAHEGLGYAYEGKGELDKAQASFERMTAGAPGRAALHKARILEKQGKKDEARKAYEAVVAGYENDVVAAEARSRLELIDLPAPGVGALEAAPSSPVAEETAKAPADDKKKSRRRNSGKN